MNTKRKLARARRKEREAEREQKRFQRALDKEGAKIEQAVRGCKGWD